MSNIIVTLEEKQISATIEEKLIAASIEEKNINVEVTGGRGPAGTSPTRLIYVADIARAGNFLGNISVNQTILNNTGVTFTWQGTGTEAIMSTSVAGYALKILSLTWILQDTSPDTALYHSINSSDELVLQVINSASVYRLCIEFYNYE